MPIDSDSLSLLYLGLQCFSKKERDAWVHMFELFLAGKPCSLNQTL